MLATLRLRVLRGTERNVFDHPLRQLVRKALLGLPDDAIDELVDLDVSGESRGGLVQDFLAQAFQLTCCSTRASTAFASVSATGSVGSTSATVLGAEAFVAELACLGMGPSFLVLAIFVPSLPDMAREFLRQMRQFSRQL